MNIILIKQDEIKVRTNTGTNVNFVTYEERGYLTMIIDNGTGECASLLMNKIDIDAICDAMWVSAEAALHGKVEE